MNEWQHEPDAKLTAEIEGSSSKSPVNTTLQTDERVLARVTDGIYRQPGSAIRELVSNAYDADAKQVVIKTDRPRFRTLSVEDDGIGMTPAALAHLLHHIGGSAKRSPAGAELGIASSEDPSLSPSGRRLIGKIGIGLFSVSQLTQRFQIVTKTAGDPYRTIALVVLRQYSEEHAPAPDEQGEYDAGLVTIWRERAADADSHGTRIILTHIRPQTRDTLQSREIWATIDSDPALAPSEARNLIPPEFHIGRVKPEDADLLQNGVDTYNNLPWDRDDRPDVAFAKLVSAVWQQVDHGIPNPRLERICDYYLRMVWQLSLAVPLPYVSGNAFNLPLKDKLYLYELPPSAGTSPTKFQLTDTETIREAKSIGSAADVGNDFTVLVDDLLLTRPLVFTDLPQTNHAVKKPILFVGRCREEFGGVQPELTGGTLEFEAYLIWAPKIAPTEHQGVLVRVHGSSGTSFDPTFLRYQVSEQTRLRQISCEIFVSEGLEAALNIDRESFNYAHPHVVYITKWLHASLRRVATIQKSIAAEIRREIREAAEAVRAEAMSSVVTQAWQAETDDPGAEPPPVEFANAVDKPTAVEPGTFRFRRESVFGEREGRRSRQDESAERKLRSIIQLLAAYGVFESLTDQQQERLLAGIRQILEVPDQ
ncbi:MAG: ATP-binding protein [Chloroflexi bacterium]|nr:ATP-binding protein [Chloroflexota bacterium]MYK62347.1 ATP-binding protein [Chloroflexota bacterium]